MGFALFQIGQVLQEELTLWVLGQQLAEFREDGCWTVMLELVQAGFNPLMRGLGSFAEQALAHIHNPLSGMVKSKMRWLRSNRCILAIVIDKTLLPFGPVHNSRHLLTPFYSQRMQLAMGQVLK